jgi:hypothetical protein
MDECYYAATSLACQVAYTLAAFGCDLTSSAAAAVADTVADATQNAVAYRRVRADELAAQCRLLRDVVGNPFRPTPTLEPHLLTPDIQALAYGAYDHRLLPSGHLDPARLAVLSDALEEAGCADSELLAHLRSPGPHIRGCFAVDAILGKS